jgi:hypothetical protein
LRPFRPIAIADYCTVAIVIIMKDCIEAIRFV